jgi:4-hydroxy-tetrahydrodipicolinate synthase
MERGLKIAVDHTAGRVPVYFGIGAINTKKCVRLAKMAVKNGAAAVSILQPMFLKPTQDELFLHFKTVAEAIPETPVLLYNNPGRVGYGMTTALITRLAHEVDNIVGMKDTSGDITLTEECVRLNRDIGFKVFGGKDTLLYASLCVGAVGGVCTAGNFMPELIGAVYEKYIAGDLQGSLEAQFSLNPVRLSMDAASFPVAAKDMAKLRGLDVGVPYLPNLPTPEGPVLDNIRNAMRQAGLIE